MLGHKIIEIGSSQQKDPCESLTLFRVYGRRSSNYMNPVSGRVWIRHVDIASFAWEIFGSPFFCLLDAWKLEICTCTRHRQAFLLSYSDRIHVHIWITTYASHTFINELCAYSVSCVMNNSTKRIVKLTHACTNYASRMIHYLCNTHTKRSQYD